MADVKHTEQTTKQPVVFRCVNIECVPEPEPGKPLEQFFDFTTKDDNPVCPKCGATPREGVQKRSLIHVLVRNRQGPIPGDGGIRYQIVCDPKRTLLATNRNGEALTGMSIAANCPGCLKKIGNNEIVHGLPVGLRDKT